MESFEHTGFWWDPRDPDTKWPGTLRFDPIEGAVLKLTIAFGPASLGGESREFDVLLGEATTLARITLLHCFETGHAEIFANAVIVGFHATEPDPPILVAAAVIEHLAEWWGKSTVAHDESLTPPNYGARYIQPQPVEVHADAVMRTVIHSGALAKFGASRISISEEIRIEFTAPEPRPLSVFQKRIHDCQDFLSIAALTLCKVEDLRISPPSEDNGPPEAIGHYYAVPVFKDPSERWAHFLFRYDDVAPRMREVFTGWLENAERLGAVRSLYLSAAYGKAFLELKLLALGQAAEAFHRRMYEGRDLYMDPAEYVQNVLAPLKTAIPRGIHSSHRQALSNRLKHGNEYSFRRRLTILFKEHEAAMRAAIPNPCGWINRIVDYRNNLTHHPVVEEQPTLNRVELLQCIYVLRILLELCFLKSMAMSADEIGKLSTRCARYQQIRQRFFSGSK